MGIMTHEKFQSNWLMLTLFLGSGPLSPRSMTEKAGPDWVKTLRARYVLSELTFSERNVNFIQKSRFLSLAL